MRAGAKPPHGAGKQIDRFALAVAIVLDSPRSVVQLDDALLGSASDMQVCGVGSIDDAPKTGIQMR